MSTLSASPENGVPCEDQRPSQSAPCRLLSRQPILDAQHRLFGYELAIRPGDHDLCDPELAAREAVDHWLMLSPPPNQGCAFVPTTRTVLAEGPISLLPAETTVLQLDPRTEPDTALFETCFRLRERGYRLALDGSASLPDLAPFMHLSDFIQVDFRTAGFADRHAIYAMAARYSTQILAKNVETDIQMRIAVSEGCSLFHGCFFSQPLLAPTRPIPQSHLVYLRLLAALHQNPADMRRVEKLISGDASLCYRVLRLANSAMQGHATTITTIREALLMVGEDAIRKMAAVAVASALGGSRSAALASLALSRARFCERLAPLVTQPAAPMYLLGMLSVLDVLLDTSIDRILQTVPIPPAMKAALAGDDSPAGRVLKLARSLESCDWPACQDARRLLAIEEGSVASLYVDSLRWASAMMEEMALPG